MSNWSITIGGVQLVDAANSAHRKIQRGSVSITQSLGGRANCSFRVISKDGTYTPAVGAPVIVTYSSHRMYRGWIWSAQERRERGTVMTTFDVVCVDLNYACDRRPSGTRSWDGQTAGQIVTDICNSDLNGEGVITTFISTGPTIPGKYEITGYPTVTEALNAIAGRAKFYWYIDAYNQMRFFSSATSGYTAPFSAARANCAEITTYRSLEEYANKVILKLPQLLRPEQTETFVGDGSRSSFDLAYPVSSVPIVKVNGSAQSVGIWGVDVGVQWYWNQGSNTVSQEGSGTPLTSAQTLAITYVGIEEIVIAATNDTELTSRQAIEGGSGLHVRVMEWNEQANREQADAKVASLLDTVDELPAVRVYRTNAHLQPLLDTLKAGDQQTIDGVQYLIRSVKWNDDPAGDMLWLEAEGVRGPLLQDFAALLQSLAGGDQVPVGAPAAGPASGSGSSAAPTQPTFANWDVGAITISADAVKNYYIGFTLTEIGLPPGDADMLQFWLYRGPSRPTDPGLWENILDLTEAGSQTVYERYISSGDWLLCATASRSNWREAPSDTTPFRVINVGVPAIVTPPADFVAELQTRVNDGQKEFRYEFRFTAPSLSDQNYRLARLAVAWVNTSDGSWATGVSKWEHVADFATNGSSVCYISGDSSSAWVSCIPPSGSAAGRRRWRLDFVNWNDEPLLSGFGSTSLSGTQLTPTEPYANGIDLTYGQSASLGKGLGKDAAGRPASSAPGVANGDFELPALVGWSSDTAGWAATTAGAFSGTCAKYTEASRASSYLYQIIPVVPGKTYRYTPYAKSDMPGVLVDLVGLDAAYNFTNEEHGGSETVGSSYQAYTRILTAAANTAFMMLRVSAHGGATSGSIWVDQVTFDEVSSVAASGAVTITGTTQLDGPDTTEGGSTYRLSSTWTPFAASEKCAAVRVKYSAAGVTEAPLGNDVVPSAGAWNVGAYPRPKTDVVATLRFFPVSSTGTEGAAMASVAITITAGAAGKLDLGQAKAGLNTLAADITLSRGAAAGQMGLSTGGFKASITTAGIENKVDISGTGITISQGTAGGSLVANAGGIVIAKTTSGVTAKTDINSTGVQISYGTTGGVTTVDSNGVTIAQGNFSVKASAAGITIRESGGGAMTLDSAGIVIQKGTSSVTVAAGGVTIVNGILSAPSITVTQGGTGYVVAINVTDGFKVTAGTRTLQMAAAQCWVKDGTSQATLGSGSLDCSKTSAGAVLLQWDSAIATVNLAFGASMGIEITANSTANFILDGRSGSYIKFTGASSYFEVTASGSYIKAPHFRLPSAVSGTKTPVGGGSPVTGWFKEICEPDGTPYFVQIFV